MLYEGGTPEFTSRQASELIRIYHTIVGRYFSSGDEHPSSFDLEPTFGKELDGAGINPVLLLENARGEAVLRVVIHHRHDCLNDDWARVHVLINKVDRTTGELDAVIEGSFLDMQAGEGRQQGRVDVHDAAGESVDERRRYYAHEAGQTNEVHVPFLQLLHKKGIKFIPSSLISLRAHMNARYVMVPGTLEGIGVGLIADDHLDPGGKLPLFDIVNDGLQVGSTAGNQDAQFDLFHNNLDLPQRTRIVLSSLPQSAAGFVHDDLSLPV